MQTSSSDYLYICTSVGNGRYVSRKISLADLKEIVNLSGDGGSGGGDGGDGGDGGGDQGGYIGDKYNFSNLECFSRSIQQYEDESWSYSHTIQAGSYTFPCKGKVVLAERYASYSKAWRTITKSTYYRNGTNLIEGNQDDYSEYGQSLHLYYWNFNVGDILTVRRNDISFFSVILESPQGSTDKLISKVVTLQQFENQDDLRDEGYVYKKVTPGKDNTSDLTKGYFRSVSLGFNVLGYNTATYIQMANVSTPINAVKFKTTGEIVDEKNLY